MATWRFGIDRDYCCLPGRCFSCTAPGQLCLSIQQIHWMKENVEQARPVVPEMCSLSALATGYSDLSSGCS